MSERCADVRRSARPGAADLKVGAVTDPAEAHADEVADVALARLHAAGPASSGRPVPVPTRVPRVGPEGGVAPADLTAEIDEARGRGRPLAPAQRARFENAMGADLSRVTIHDDARSARLTGALGARAFTIGSDIFFGASQLRAGDVDGDRVLAHELAHTTQAASSVRRLMSSDHFLAGRPANGSDKPLAKLLSDYARTTNRTSAEWKKRSKLLSSMTSALAKHQAVRSPEVTLLDQQVQKETVLVDEVRAVLAILEQKKPTKDQLALAMRGALRVRDAALALEQVGGPLPVNQAPDAGKLQGDIRNALQRLDPTARFEVTDDLAKDDLATLVRLRDDPDTTPHLREILAEIAECAADVHVRETRGVASGAVLTGQKARDQGITKKFVVDVQLDQSQGSEERLSSLLHEMTHVAVQQTYGNTSMHLAYPVSLTDDAVVEMSERRTVVLQQLEDLLPTLSPPLSAGQLEVFKDKTVYPAKNVKNTLGSYAKAFSTKAAAENGLPADRKAQIDGLVARGANNTLIEYDTVISQMVFLAERWGVPVDNPFRARLIEASTAALEERQEARKPTVAAPPTATTTGVSAPNDGTAATGGPVWQSGADRRPARSSGWRPVAT